MKDLRSCVYCVLRTSDSGHNVTMADRTVSVDQRFLPFGALSSDTSTARSEYVTVYPTGGIAGPTIEFNISASQSGFVSLSQSYISSLLTIVKASATHTGVLPFANVTAPCEGFADAMWSNVQLYINGVDVSDATPATYPYAAFYRNALTKSQDWVAGGLTHYVAPAVALVEGTDATALAQLSARSLSTPAGWGAEFQGYALCDKAVGHVADQGSVAGGNWGAVTETPFDSPAHAFRQSKIATNGGNGTAAAPTTGLPKGEFITTPQLGMWQNSSFLPANVDIRLVLTKSADNFCLMDSITAPSSAITWGVAGDCSVRLMLKRVYADPATQEEFNRTTLERPLRYNITRSRVQPFQVGTANQVDATNLLTGVRPDVVIVQFIPTDAYAGDYPYNPFASQNVIPYNTATAATISGDAGDFISSIHIVWGGTQVPLRPMAAASVNDTAESYAAYLAAASGGVFGVKTPMISPAGFRAGRQFFTFQLNPDGARAGSQAMSLDDRGSLEVHATIVRTAHVQQTTMMVVGFHAATVEINAARELTKIGM